MTTMDHHACSFRRFFVGFCILVATTSLFALLVPSFMPVPLGARISIALTNTSNVTAYKVEMHFQVLDLQNRSRIGFFNTTYSLIAVPNGTWAGPDADGSGFIVYIPEWRASENVQFLVDSINVTSDFPIDFSSLAFNPISYPIPSEPPRLEFEGILAVVGRTFVGTQSIASFHQFTYNGIPQPLEKRVQTRAYFSMFFAFLYLFALLIPLLIWRPEIWVRFPFATLTLVLLMVFLYVFIGSGREILAMPPCPWNNFKILGFGTFMHVSDDHILGNLAVFIPLSMLMELWLNVKSDWRKFAIWYILPILASMVVFVGIGFSIANEFVAWALWGLVIVDQKTKTRLDLLLCLFSGVMAYTFFSWLFSYLPYVYSPAASTLWGLTAQIHLLTGLIGAVIFGLIALTKVKQKANKRKEGIGSHSS